MPSSLLLATTNPGKQAELRALVSGLAGSLVIPADLGLDLQVPEDGPDYASNAAIKAASYARSADMWALADDTGLEVDALGGLPGLRSARLAESDVARRASLLAQLAAYPPPWTARFRCAVALAGPGGELAVGHGACEGEVVPTARGQGGFGYDPIFLVSGTGQTMAELPFEVKNRLSHRARAVADLLSALRRGALPASPLHPAPEA